VGGSATIGGIGCCDTTDGGADRGAITGGSGGTGRTRIGSESGAADRGAMTGGCPGEEG
jgi:hypothetical protein